jgi:hypothetical protein
MPTLPRAQQKTPAMLKVARRGRLSRVAIARHEQSHTLKNNGKNDVQSRPALRRISGLDDMQQIVRRHRR